MPRPARCSPWWGSWSPPQFPAIALSAVERARRPQITLAIDFDNSSVASKFYRSIFQAFHGSSWLSLQTNASAALEIELADWNSGAAYTSRRLLGSPSTTQSSDHALHLHQRVAVASVISHDDSQVLRCNLHFHYRLNIRIELRWR